jgi:BirA family biotin operon repressor/biotin-[acetyl-CoA-carboxylase] ligase
VSVHLDSTSSTQDEARSRLEDVPVLVTASRQTRGRGRSGNPWWGAPRPLFASLAVRPGWPAETRSRLSLVAGMAMREQLPYTVRLKWPNDLVDGATWTKVGGILAEAAGDDVVFGVGLNLWWPDPPDGAGGIYPTDPGADQAAVLAGAWAHALLRRIAAGPGDWGRDEYTAACATVGADITWEPDGRGTAVGVAGDGSLVVKTATGVQHLSSSHVRQVRPGYAVPPSTDPEATE